MSERRKPTLVLHVALAGGGKIFADLFESVDFPGAGAGPGLYRMRIRTSGRKSAWYCQGDSKYTYLAFPRAAETLLEVVRGESPAGEPEPWLPVGSVVRVPTGNGPLRERCRSLTIPFQGTDSRWRVFAGIAGAKPVLVSEILVVELQGFICRGMPPEGVPCPTKAEALAKGWISDGEYPRRRDFELTLAELRAHAPRKRAARFGKRPEVEHGRAKPGA